MCGGMCLFIYRGDLGLEDSKRKRGHRRKELEDKTMNNVAIEQGNDRER